MNDIFLSWFYRALMSRFNQRRPGHVMQFAILSLCKKFTGKQVQQRNQQRQGYVAQWQEVYFRRRIGHSIYNSATLSIDIFDVSVSQNRVRMHEINKFQLPRLLSKLLSLFILFSLCQNSSQTSLDLFTSQSNENIKVSKSYILQKHILAY